MTALRLLGTLWALPSSLIGLLVVLVCGPKSWRWRGLVLEVEIARFVKGFSGITIGTVIAYRTGQDTPELLSHEHRHVLQGLILGPLYLPVYGACAFVAWLQGAGIYEGNVMEADARRAAARAETARNGGV